MTLGDLRRAAELLPPGASLTLSRDAILAAFTEGGDAVGNVTAPAAVDSTSTDPETWLTAEECSAILSVSTRWCYDHALQLGARKLSRRCVRFSSRTVQRYLTRTRERHV